MLRGLLAATVLVIFLVLPACAGEDELEGDVLVTADRVFTGREVIDDGAVLVSGRTIVAVGRRADLHAKPKRTIALGDATILPGLIDLHVHQLVDIGNLAGGVTTVRSLGSPMEDLPLPAVRPGTLRIVVAGPLVTVPGGYPIPVYGPDIALPVRGPEDARRAVRRLVRLQADAIKIALEPGVEGDWPMLSRREVEAIVTEAHRNGLLVTAHVSEARGTRLALAAGVDELAHMPCDAPLPGLMRELAQREIEIVGTLHVLQIPTPCPATLANARSFVDAGGTLLYGSDYPNPGIPAGIDVEELRLIVRVGLTPRQALEAATARAGEQLRLEPLGTLVAEAPADIIAVRGDPFRELDRLRDIVLVVAGGHPYIAQSRILPVVG